MNIDALDSFLGRAARLTGVCAQTFELHEDFMDLVARWAHLPGTVALLSGGNLDCARFHLLGALPWLTLRARTQTAELTVDDRTLHVSADPFTVLRKIMAYFELSHTDPALPLAAGLMGYLAYDLKDCLETLPRTSVDELHLPAMLLYAPSLLVVHDRHLQTTRLMVPQRPVGGKTPDTLIKQFHEVMAAPAPSPVSFGAENDDLQSNFTQTEYQTGVRQAIDYIAAGDVYQVNLSQRFKVPFKGDGFALFRQLFAQNPAPFFAFIQGGDHQIVSTSPERFLRQSNDRVETRPIKGTRPRGKNSAEDLALRNELAASSKDDAELSMIVDLLRNDIGKVCSAGTVRVVEHKRLEAYQNVYHLVSVVEGRLDPDKDSVDLIAATFPGGSITGCPKVRAMEIIDELESCRRHVYCGSIGYIGFHRTMDLSIAIRTATIVNDTLFFSVGGAIVYESKPLEEYRETLDKGRTLLSACRCGSIQSRKSVAWHNGRLRPYHQVALPITDHGLLYGHGFFETLRVDRRCAPLLTGHLERFARTWQALMPGPLPDLTWETLIAQVIQANDLQTQCASVKILATRGSRTRPPWDHNLLVLARPYVHRLQAIAGDGLYLGTYPYPRQTPLADYKTLNYLYYQQAGQWARNMGFHEALVLNPDGTVSETHTANVLLIEGREVIRPKSAAVLPGVMAAAVCRQLATWDYHIVERPVRPAELISAQQVLATNGLMGAVPVLGIDNRRRAAGDDLWVRINDALIPGWREQNGQMSFEFS